jgi:hypothetical protein
VLFEKKRKKDCCGSKVVYTYNLTAPISHAVIDRLRNLGTLNLESSDGRFQLKSKANGDTLAPTVANEDTCATGTTCLTGTIGATRLRAVLTPDNPTLITTLDSILTDLE